MAKYITQGVNKGSTLKHKPLLANDMGWLKLKRMQLEAIGCWCSQAITVGRKEHLPWERNAL